jgi:glycosyltransferase 2 family protein
MELALSTYRIFEISTVATFYGLFAPGELGGGAVRWYRMSRPTGRRAQVVAAIVVERIVDTIVLVVCGLAFWFLDSPPFDRTVVNVTLLAALAALVLLLALAVSAHTSAAFRWSISWVPWEKVRGKLTTTAEKVFLSMRTLRDLSARQMAWLWVLSLARVLVAVVMLMCFAIGLGMHVDFVTIGWIRSFLNIITMLPISFSGLGVREGSLVLLLTPYGVPAALAVAFSLMHFFVYVVMATVGGLLEVKNLALLGWSQRGVTAAANGSEDPKGI